MKCGAVGVMSTILRHAFFQYCHIQSQRAGLEVRRLLKRQVSGTGGREGVNQALSRQAERQGPQSIQQSR